MRSRLLARRIGATLFLSVGAALALFTQPWVERAHAFSSGPDPGRTGAPGELTCATGECHGNRRAIEPARFQIIAPSSYVPGQTYQIIIRHVAADLSRQRWGFQLTALGGANVRAGSWQSLDATTHVVEDARLQRQYAQHTTAGTFVGQSGGASWNVHWSAPATDLGPVTFYAAGNQADNNSSNTGDEIFMTQVTIPRGDRAPPPALGSFLFFNLFVSSPTNRTATNARVSLTNTHEEQAATIRLLIVDGESGAAADHFVRLAPNQTTTFLASDLDPGTTGYLLALACDAATGCPINFNFLLGDAYVKLSSGHAANLVAESFAMLSATTGSCAGGVTTLRFDGINFSRAPRTLALSGIFSHADSNNTLLVLNRLGGDLRLAAGWQGGLAGFLYDDAEQAFSFAFTANSGQFISQLSNNFPRTTPRFAEIIPASRSGWLKLWAEDEAALLGAVLTFNPSSKFSSRAYTQGHNLYHLTLTNAATLTLPITPSAF